MRAARGEINLPSYWLAATQADHGPPPRRLPSEVEVVVVGGGVMGVATTYWLARHGVAVLLLEAGLLASRATGRNAGLALAGRHPIEDPALVRTVVREEKIEADYAEPGHLALASSPEIWERICQEAAGRVGSASPVFALELAECEAVLGMRISDRLLGGRWLPNGGSLHPVRFTHGLAAAAVRRGAILATHTRVVEVARSNLDDWNRITTPRGCVRARHVVFACGVHLAELLPSFREVITPVRGQVMSTEPLPALFRVGLAIDWGTVYWRQTPDGVIVLGGYRNLDPEAETGTSEALNPRIHDALTRFLPETFPELPAIRVGMRWSGCMDYSKDGRPLIGPLGHPPNQWVVAGFGGHGMPPALGAGKAIAEAIVSGQVPTWLEPFDPGRFAKGSAAVQELS